MTELHDHRRSPDEERLRAALQACDIGTYSWDVHSDTFEFDEGVERLFGFAPGEGSSLEAYIARIHDDDRVAWLETLEQCAVQGRDFEREYRVVDPHGRVRWLLDKGTWLRNGGTPTSLTGAVVDLTEQKRHERALQQADRRKDEFLAMLGHELRNPLAALRTALDLVRLSSGGMLDGPHAVMDRQVGILTRLVDDLLDVSRITRGRVALRKESLDLSRVVMAAVDASAALIERRRHHLTTVLPKRPLFVVGDAVRLEQVVTNLLTNAAKYTEPGGSIRVSLEQRGAVVELRVRDTGVGLDSEMLEEGFELFRQDERDLARSQGGLGLGLTIVRSIVELHGGRVGVSSSGRGRGSEFSVTLPAAPRHVQEGAHARADDASEGQRESGAGELPVPHRVLVVDDNRDGAEILTELLRHLGAEVEMATSGEQALELVDELHPQLVLLDIGMPGMDGYETARRLQRAHDAPKLVAMTGYGQDEDRRRSAMAGFSRHLVKPIRIEQLSEVLDDLGRASL